MRVVIYKERQTGKIKRYHIVPEDISDNEICEKIRRWNAYEKNDIADLFPIYDGSFFEYLINELESKREVDTDAVKSALYDLSKVEEFLEDLLRN